MSELQDRVVGQDDQARGLAVDAVTVTANPAIDQTISVPGFRAGEVNRVVHEELTPGGKGVNVAAFLNDFGVSVLVTGFLGTPNAGLFEAFFESHAIPHRFVAVDGTTRTGVKSVDDEAGATTWASVDSSAARCSSPTVKPGKLMSVVAPGRWVVLAGSLPPGAPATTYRRLTELAHQGGALVAVDTSEPALSEAIAAGPDLVKPNQAELEELTGRRLADREAVVGAAHELAARGLATVVVSLGAEGAVFVREGEAVKATPPKVRVASTVGAGDAMVAGTVAGTLRELPLAEVAALATAFSAVKISRGRHWSVTTESKSGLAG